jgi:hypothetical protein
VFKNFITQPDAMPRGKFDFHKLTAFRPGFVGPGARLHIPDGFALAAPPERL